MKTYIDRCPFCGYSEFIEARQMQGEAYVSGEALLGQQLHHTICRHCGSVVRSFVEDPEKAFKEEKSQNKGIIQ